VTLQIRPSARASVQESDHRDNLRRDRAVASDIAPHEAPMSEPSSEPREHLFPRLTPHQVERLRELGNRRQAQAGEVLYDQGGVHKVLAE
jgi:hypothetical protein